MDIFWQLFTSITSIIFNDVNYIRWVRMQLRCYSNPEKSMSKYIISIRYE